MRATYICMLCIFNLSLSLTTTAITTTRFEITSLSYPGENKFRAIHQIQMKAVVKVFDNNLLWTEKKNHLKHLNLTSSLTDSNNNYKVSKHCSAWVR